MSSEPLSIITITEDDVAQATHRRLERQVAETHVREPMAEAVRFLMDDDGEAAYERGGSWARELAEPLALLLARIYTDGDGTSDIELLAAEVAKQVTG